MPFYLKKILIIALIGFCTAALSAEGRADKKSPADSELQPAEWNTAVDGDIVKVEGRVRLVGNEPFPQLVITDSTGKDWMLDKEGAEIIKPFLQQTVVVRGEVKLKKMVLANGKELEPMRILSDLKLISPQH